MLVKIFFLFLVSVFAQRALEDPCSREAVVAPWENGPLPEIPIFRASAFRDYPFLQSIQFASNARLVMAVDASRFAILESIGTVHWVRLFKVGIRKPIVELKTAEETAFARFGIDGTLWVPDRGRLYGYDSEGRLIRGGHIAKDPVVGFSISPDGKRAATAHLRKTRHSAMIDIYVQEDAPFRTVHSFKISLARRGLTNASLKGFTIARNAPNKLLYVLGKNLFITDLRRHSVPETRSFSLNHSDISSDTPVGLALSPNGKYAAVQFSKLEVFDLETRKRLRITYLNPYIHQLETRDFIPVNCPGPIAFSKDGLYINAVGDRSLNHCSAVKVGIGEIFTLDRHTEVPPLDVFSSFPKPRGLTGGFQFGYSDPIVH